MNEERVALNRRRFFECLSAMGLGCTLMPDALAIAAQDADTVTIEMIEAAQKIAGVSFTRAEQQAILTRLNARCRIPGRVCRVCAPPTLATMSSRRSCSIPSRQVRCCRQGREA